MTDVQLKNQIAAQLDLQNLHDLKAVMNTVEGRRFFSWLMMRCGMRNPSFSRDGPEQTVFNEGMRNAALMVEGCVKALGLHGVDLVHVAEKEYAVFQEAIKQEIQAKEKGVN